MKKFLACLWTVESLIDFWLATLILVGLLLYGFGFWKAFLISTLVSFAFKIIWFVASGDWKKYERGDRL